MLIVVKIELQTKILSQVFQEDLTSRQYIVYVQANMTRKDYEEETNADINEPKLEGRMPK